MTPASSKTLGRLVQAPQLLAALWEEECRPSLRWLRYQQKAKAIPSIRVGRLVFFDPESVKEALIQRNTVKAKGGAR